MIKRNCVFDVDRTCDYIGLLGLKSLLDYDNEKKPITFYADFFFSFFSKNFHS